MGVRILPRGAAAVSAPAPRCGPGPRSEPRPSCGSLVASLSWHRLCSRRRRPLRPPPRSQFLVSPAPLSLVEGNRTLPRLRITINLIRHFLTALELTVTLRLWLGGLLRSTAICTAKLTGFFVTKGSPVVFARLPEAVFPWIRILSAASTSPHADLFHPLGLAALLTVASPAPRGLTRPTSPRAAAGSVVGSMSIGFYVWQRRLHQLGFSPWPWRPQGALR